MLVRGGRAASDFRPFAGWMVAGPRLCRRGLLAPVLLRPMPAIGFVAVLFLFAVVWATDIVAYFVGRAVGGPKLRPRGQPEEDLVRRRRRHGRRGRGGSSLVKLAGLVVAPMPVAGGAWCFRSCRRPATCSNPRVKRRFGAKDASQLIPGHGGLMDRLDGFVCSRGGRRIRCCAAGLDGAGPRPAGVVS